ncbi:unnamed protein product [Coccothraustes coccothraustes]
MARPGRHGTDMVPAGTRHISPPKKAKFVLVLFFPFTSRILTGLQAVRAVDAARAANSRPRRHMQERVTYSTFVLLEPSGVYPQCIALSTGLILQSYSLTALSRAEQRYIR